MTTFVVNQNKTLVRTTLTDAYEQENLAGSLLFLVPETVAGIDLTQSSCFLNTLNPDALPDIHILQRDEVSPREGYMAYTYPLTKCDTFKDGDVRLWLEFVDSDQQVVLRTSESSYRVKNHPCADGHHHHGHLSVLHEFEIFMDSVRKDVTESRDVTVANAAAAQEAAEKIADYVDKIELNALEWDDIKNKPEKYPPSEHKHAPSDITTDGDTEYIIFGGNASLE